MGEGGEMDYMRYSFVLTALIYFYCYIRLRRASSHYLLYTLVSWLNISSYLMYLPSHHALLAVVTRVSPGVRFRVVVSRALGA